MKTLQEQIKDMLAGPALKDVLTQLAARLDAQAQAIAALQGKGGTEVPESAWVDCKQCGQTRCYSNRTWTCSLCGQRNVPPGGKVEPVEVPEWAKKACGAAFMREPRECPPCKRMTVSWHGAHVTWFCIGCGWKNKVDANPEAEGRRQYDAEMYGDPLDRPARPRPEPKPAEAEGPLRDGDDGMGHNPGLVPAETHSPVASSGTQGQAGEAKLDDLEGLAIILKTDKDDYIDDDGDMAVYVKPEQGNHWAKLLTDILAERDPLRQQLAAAQEETEKEKGRRVYYQDIVYSVCLEIDKIEGRTVGHRIVCGHIGEPSTQVQDAVARLAAAQSRPALAAGDRETLGKLRHWLGTGHSPSVVTLHGVTYSVSDFYHTLDRVLDPTPPSLVSPACSGDGSGGAKTSGS